MLLAQAKKKRGLVRAKFGFLRQISNADFIIIDFCLLTLSLILDIGGLGHGAVIPIYKNTCVVL